MSDKNEIIKQTKGAFDFLQKLYFEVSYIIKEVEGLLGEQPEEFIIGRPSGYGINTRSSTGLESNNVNLWLIRKLAVFFVPRASTEISGGMTNTQFSKDLKVIYLRITLDDKEMTEPVVKAGILYDLERKEVKSRLLKFENAMAHFEYNGNNFFKMLGNTDYEDNYLKFKVNMFERKLFDLNSGDDVAKMLVGPMVELFRKTQMANR
jgi:hypothetical protein